MCTSFPIKNLLWQLLSFYHRRYLFSIVRFYRSCAFTGLPLFWYILFYLSVVVLAIRHAVAVDGFPVVLHGNRRPAVLLTALAHGLRFAEVAVFAVEVVAAEQEGRAFVAIAGDGVVCHRRVARGVAEAEHGLQADLSLDHADLVHLEVFDDEIAAASRKIL